MPTTSKNSKYGIQSLDVLGSKFKIGYSTLTGKFQTKLGGYLTILMGVLSSGFFCIIMSQFFSKEAPVVMTSSESGSREVVYDLYESNLYLPIGAVVGLSTIPADQLKRYITIKAFVDRTAFNADSTSSETYSLTRVNSFDYMPCRDIKNPHIRDYLSSFVSQPGVADIVTCPDFRGLQKDFKQTTSYITYTGNLIETNVYPCSLPDPSQCASEAEMRALHVEYAYPFKLLKPSDYKNPVENLPMRLKIKVDPRTTKIVKEFVQRNKVFDDTMSLLPAKLKEEYLTLKRDSIDFGVRDQTQLHCPRSEIEKGVFGRCQPFVTFDYLSSSEVIVTTRSYKKLTTMLGEFGGILKIITTGAFFVYGVYSMRKVKTVLGGIIFGGEEGSEKVLKRLIDGKEDGSKSGSKVKKLNQVGMKKERKINDQFEDLVSRFVSQRSNVDNLMQMLNIVELIEKVLLTDDEKKLLPLVLLKSKKKELKNHQKKTKKRAGRKVRRGSDISKGIQIISIYQKG